MYREGVLLIIYKVALFCYDFYFYKKWFLKANNKAKAFVKISWRMYEGLFLYDVY